MPEFDAREPEALEENRLARNRDAVIRATGIAEERMLILNEARIRLTYLGRAASTYKVVDTGTGDSRRIALDESGQELDIDDLLRKERAAAVERYGNLQNELHRLLEHRSDDAALPVLLKYVVKEEEAIDKRELVGKELDDTALREIEDRARRIERSCSAQASEIHREALRRLGLETAGDEAISGPFVRARLSVAAIRRLARDERIAFIGLDGEREIPDYPTIAESLPTTRTDFVHSAGAKGAGIRIAVLESGSLTTPEACFNIASTQVAGAAPNSHMTQSAGIIGNRYNGGTCSGVWEGYAPEASVYLANASNYVDRYDWARANNVNVVTMSWHFSTEETSGDLHSRDVFFDYWVLRWPYPSVFTSAGNEAASDAYSSGKGFNFFGVANVLNDGDGNRCNDAIDSSSSWKDPTSPHSDREIPEIASPGSRHDLLGSSFGGTSCATPVTASIASLLMSRNPSLKFWPEAIRAILLATANYQRADGADWSQSADGKDGTGLTNAQYGMWTTDHREETSTPQFRAHDYGLMTSGDFIESFFVKAWSPQTFTTSSRIRVAFTWNSKATSTTSSILDADLDLWLYDPDGILVAWSSTWDSNYEFIEFTPAKIGAYTVKVRGYSVPPDFSSWYAIAWTTHYELC